MATLLRFKDAMKGGIGNRLYNQMLDDLGLNEEELGHKHTISPDNDYTLCGIAYGEYIEAKNTKNGKITCPNCIALINYCKNFKKGIDF